MKQNLRNLHYYWAKCPVCDNEFTYKYSDVENLHLDTKYIRCPECNTYMEHALSSKMQVSSARLVRVAQ